MTVSDIINVLEGIAPAGLQESYDNSGLITGDRSWEVSGVLICLDSTPGVIEEAIQKNCNLVIAHHPIVFRGLKQLTGSNYVERTVIQAIKNDIAIYAIHTNLDNVLHEGVNGKIARKLGLQDIAVLKPLDSDLVDGPTGAGVIGNLPQPLAESEFLGLVKDTFNAGVVRHTAMLGGDVQSVAVCGGSGSFLLSHAIANGADAFITADFKYHEFFDADGKILIADVGHYESEQFTIELIGELLSKNFTNFAPNFSDTKTNPVNYYT